MPETSAFVFHHNFYQKPKIDLKSTEMSKETRQKILILQQNYDDIVHKHSSDIGLTHLEEMTTNTDLNLPPVTSKPYPLPLKHHKLMKEEIENLLEAGLIERSMNQYVAPIIVVPRRSKPGAPLAETKRLVIDNCNPNEQIHKVKLYKQNQKAV